MDLSILIPSRNEEFLSLTVKDILRNIRGSTEVIVILDGDPANPPIPEDKRVRVISLPKSVGQRAATNIGARESKAKYIMKTDAHCAFDEGFDVKLMQEMQDDWTVVPGMYRLHIFDRICVYCDWREDHGPMPEKCPSCGSPVERDMIWKHRHGPFVTAIRFDHMLTFKYWQGYKRRQPQAGNIVDMMSLLGACFMLTREKYWELNICDETYGSWGQQGTEVACKTWLSGGRLVCNRGTWFAHLFRTQPGFKFPYPTPRTQRHSRRLSREIFLYNKWEGQKKPLSWLIEKFEPIEGWHDTVYPRRTIKATEAAKEQLALVMAEGKKFLER